MSESKDRRNFLKLLLTGGAIAASAPITVGQTVLASPEDKNNKIKMLTEDGKLVEIDREVFDKVKTREKVSILDIHGFVKPPKK